MIHTRRAGKRRVSGVRIYDPDTGFHTYQTRACAAQKASTTGVHVGRELVRSRESPVQALQLPTRHDLPLVVARARSSSASLAAY